MAEFEIVFDFNVSVRWLDPPSNATDLFIRERMRQGIESDVKWLEKELNEKCDDIIDAGIPGSIKISIEGAKE